MARRRFGDSRGRGAGYSDAEIRGLFPRFGLNEVQRSQSTASYNRRKPVLLSTGTPELAANAVTTAKVATNAVTTVELSSGPANPDRAVAANNIKTGVIGNSHIDGRLGDSSVPSNIAYKNNGRVPASDLSIPGLGDNASNDAGKALDVASFGSFKNGLPDFGNFARNSDISAVKASLGNKTTGKNVKALIQKYVKPSATKGL